MSAEAWQAWLADPEGTAPLAEPERAIEALRFLAGETNQPPDATGNLAEALVSLLAETRRYDLLLACAEANAVAVSKRARKEIHRLRSHGADIAEPAPRAAAAGGPGATPAGQEDRRAAISCPTQDGQMLVLLRLRGAVDRRLYAAVATINDTRGLVRATGYVAKSGLYGTMVRSVREKTAVAETDFDYAVSRLHEAASLAREHGRILPDAWVMLKPQLPAPGPMPPHPAETLQAGELPDAARQWALLDEPELRTMLPSMAALEAMQHLISDMLGSQVIVDDKQRAEQLAHKIEDLVSKELEGPSRDLWGRRLQDAAWVAAQNRSRKTSEAVLAIRDALLHCPAPTSIPFFRHIMVRAFVDQVPASLLAHAVPGLPASLDAAPEAPSKTSPLWSPGQDRDPAEQEPEGDLIVPG